MPSITPAKATTRTASDADRYASPNNGADIATTIKGEEAATAWVSASGKYRKAMTKTAPSTTASSDLTACNQGLALRATDLIPRGHAISSANKVKIT